MISSLNPFAAPSVSTLEARELREVEKKIYELEASITWEKKQLEYFKLRKQHLERTQ